MAVTTRDLIRALLVEKRDLERQLGYVDAMIAQQRAVEIHMQSVGHKRVNRASGASAEPPGGKVERA